MLFALVLAILVKLLIETENPLLCAGFYTTLVLIFGLLGLGLGSASWIELLSGVLIAFLLSFVYFWLLNRIAMGSGPWWLVLLGGAVVALFL